MPAHKHRELFLPTRVGHDKKERKKGKKTQEKKEERTRMHASPPKL